MKNLKYNLLALAVLALAITPSFANSITIFGTGQGLGPGGVPDPNYDLISAPSGVPLHDARTIPPNLPGWVLPSPGTQWINPYGVGTMNAPFGLYDYRTTFDLTGLNPLTAVLTGEFAADNWACISLNFGITGICTTGGNYGFNHYTPFTISCALGTCGSGFLPGINTLDFIVQNNELVTGLEVEISGTASPTTPEPSSLLLMGTGVLGLIGVVRRKLVG
jgi:hypothetical protein